MKVWKLPTPLWAIRALGLLKKENKWEKWTDKSSNTSKDDQSATNPKAQGNNPLVPQGDRDECGICGLRNHITRDCRRMICDLCGLNNHTTYDCRECVPWHFGPEMCATQVEDQSFFYIDECIDPKALKEKSSTAVITVLDGDVTAKQIEHEFMNLIGANVWRWHARPIAENKFVMRFPSPKIVKEWSYFRSVAMRTVNASLAIEPWTPSVGDKGTLQQAWFKVKNIPQDQRSVRTLAKVGGLVGKVVEIDEEMRFNQDSVRMKIACRDVSRVPKKAEGAQGIHLFDFIFERETSDVEKLDKLKSGIHTSVESPKKKPRADTNDGKRTSNAGEGNKEIQMYGADQNKFGKKVMIQGSSSAPSKFAPGSNVWRREQQENKSVGKSKAELECVEKVFIPENIEDIESGSETFSDKINELMNENRPPSPPASGGMGKFSEIRETAMNVQLEDMCIDDIGKKDGDKHTMENRIPDTEMIHKHSQNAGWASKKDNSRNEKAQIPEPLSPNPTFEVLNSLKTVNGETQSTEEPLVITQESVNQQLDVPGNDEGKNYKQGEVDERRRSSRLRTDSGLTTMDKVIRMSKKRNLEGLYSSEDKEMLMKGAEDMLQIALQLLDHHQGRARRLRLEQAPSEDEEAADSSPP